MRYDRAWYKSLNKPPFQPPAEIFTPVWMILYSIMGMAFLLFIYTPIKTHALLGYLLFMTQFVLNLSWTPIFFGLQRIREAFFICVLLTITVLFTIIVFFMNSILAGILLIPYLLWLIFACVLNFTIWQLNKA